MTLDARTSDAIALALRFKCPIYTTEEILEKAGIVLDFDETTGGPVEKESDPFIKEEGEPDFLGSRSSKRSDLSKHTHDELKTMLEEAVANEDYELASEIRDEIKSRPKD